MEIDDRWFTQQSRIPVSGGSILCRTRQGRSRPVVFVPGWGADYSVFDGLRSGIGDDVTLHFIETREKRSSEILPRASFTMRRFARDVSTVVESLGLSDTDYVLAGTCFGSAVCLEALARGAVTPSVTVLFDPMPRLWVPRWLLHTVAPILPLGLISSMRPLIRRALLHGMQEVAQRSRTQSIIDNAELWKWKRGSYSMRDWDVYGAVEGVTQAVHVYNGTSDRFHSSGEYPRVAAAIANATFLGFAVQESERERFMGEVMSEYARSDGDSVPRLLAKRSSFRLKSHAARESFKSVDRTTGEVAI